MLVYTRGLMFIEGKRYIEYFEVLVYLHIINKVPEQEEA